MSGRSCGGSGGRLERAQVRRGAQKAVVDSRNEDAAINQRLERLTSRAGSGSSGREGNRPNRNNRNNNND